MLIKYSPQPVSTIYIYIYIYEPTCETHNPFNPSIRSARHDADLSNSLSFCDSFIISSIILLIRTTISSPCFAGLEKKN